MNMAHKHLHELLNEDQEPFNLKSYISERRGQLKRPNPSTTLQVKKRKPITAASSSSPLISKRNLCKHACFLSFHDSPDVRKSPLFLDFPSPSPTKSPRNGNLMLKVPARTAALLLEAAIRVQKKQKTRTQSQTQIKNAGFGLFGSILKKLKDRNKTKKREISNIKSVKTIDEVKEEVKAARISAYEMSLSCSCNNSRLSSAEWSESNEEKSFDLESCSSFRSEDSLEDAFAAYEKRFCSSPSSPFRFSLQRSESSGRRTPDFTSPAASPSHRENEEKEKYEAEDLNEIGGENEEEQCSPVSVLDPLFEEVDDDDGHEGGDEDEYDEDEDEEENDYDLECSYAIVQRAKHQLLDKLRRFERLAELDPIELEKRMMEDMDDEDDYDDQAYEEEECQDDELLSSHNNDCLDTLTSTLFSESNFHHSHKIPADMKKLVSDLISEEKSDNNEKVIKSVRKKLNSWKEVEPNTIDMMVQLDFGREFDGWKNYQEQVAETATEMEIEIWRVLIEELNEELVY